MQNIVDISRIFQELARSKKEVTLVNAYRGIPISSQAQVVEAVDIAVRLQVERRQFVCVYTDQLTFIQHPAFEKNIRATLLQSDLQRCTVVLTDYEISDRTLGDRNQIRVSPIEPIKISFKTTDQDRSFKVEVADISLYGLGVYLDNRLFSPAVLKKGTPVNVVLALPGVYKQVSLPELSSNPMDSFRTPSSSSLRINPLLPMASSEPKQAGGSSTARQVISPDLRVKGTIVNTRHEVKNGRYRIGILLQPDEQSRSVLAQYISQRQTDLIRELNKAFEELLRTPKS